MSGRRSSSPVSTIRRSSSASSPARAGRLGSTTHIAALDRDGWACSVTCSNGSASGVIVPGTGVHLNNMLGEQDLNPLGFHRHPAGRRMPSMMSPTVVLARSAHPAELAVGSAGSNRIRSAVLQTIIRSIDDGLPAQEAVEAPRVHFEDDVVYTEPGIDTAELEHAGRALAPFRARNLFFGGAQAAPADAGRRVLRRRRSAPRRSRGRRGGRITRSGGGARAWAAVSVPVAVLAAVAAVAAGCGLNVELPDLFLVTRTGSGPKLTLVVNEGGGITCNGGRQKTLSSSQLITARDLADNLSQDAHAKLTFPAPPGTVYRYTVKLQQGTISFPDRAATAHQYLGQIEAFVLQAAQQYCT